MPSEVELILRLWPIFVGVIMLVAWLIRLESNHLSLRDRFEDHKDTSKKELDDHKRNVKDNEIKVWEKIDTIKDQNIEILKSLSRLEGQLSRKGVNNEVL
jgi:hypothetical protein